MRIISAGLIRTSHNSGVCLNLPAVFIYSPYYRLAADIEIMMRERFNVLNHIIWAKPSGRWNGCNKESLRSYFPTTERILFAEHYQGPYKPKSDGYAEKGNELKQHVMAPLISYFRDAREALGISSKQIAAATGKKNMVFHWFSGSQWQLPNETDYQKLQSLFTQVAIEKHQNGELATPHHRLVALWHSLNRKYSEPARRVQITSAAFLCFRIRSLYRRLDT